MFRGKQIALLSVVSLLLSSLSSHAQFGGHILGQDWQIMSSEAVRVIYPSGMSEHAQRIANIINYVDQNNTRSVGEKRKRIDLLIQNKTTEPNGFVSLSPYKSEFFATPPQNATIVGSLDWLDVLSVHEFRHAQQQVNQRVGLTKFLWLFQGQAGWALGMNLSVPNWFFEGDAVIAESALSLSGRGRLPTFTIEQRALAVEGLNYKYLKHRNGSLRDRLPNHYPLGFMTLNYVRDNFGNDVTKTIMKDGARYKGIIYPFSRAMKKQTGTGTGKTYQLAWEAKKLDWAQQIKEANIIETTPVTQKPKKVVTDYRYPLYLENGDMIAIKSSFKKTEKLVRLSGGRETSLTSIGLTTDNYITVGGDMVAWSEYGRNPRRAHQNYSNIVTFDLKSNTKKRINAKSRYFSPAFSPSGEQLLAVHISPEQVNELHLLDPNSGTILKRLSNPDNDFLSRPTWSPDGKSIIYVAKNNRQLTLKRYDLADNSMTELLPWSAHIVDVPTVKDGKVYFMSSFSGIDNIFYTSLDGSKGIYQVTSVPVGAFDPTVAPDGKSIAFTEFTNMGYVVSEQSLSTASRNSFSVIEPVDMPIFKSAANDTEGGNIFAKIPTEKYTSKPYKGAVKGTRLHSWSFTPSVATPSVGLSFDNIRNDFSLKLKGALNRNEDNAITYGAGLQYAQLFPVISLNGALGARNTDYYTAADTLAVRSFQERSLGLNVGLPFRWIRGNFISNLNLGAGYNVRSLGKSVVGDREIAATEFGAYGLNFLVSSKRRRAIQNVGTRLGFEIKGNYEQSLKEVPEEKLAGSGALFLPGLLANHSIRLTVGYQKELLSNDYQFADGFEYPRGYTTPINDEFTAFTANYGFPLLYPDFGIAGIVYFKRIRANLFYDFGVGSRQGLETDYASAGGELIFDNIFVNLLPIDIGLRFSYLLENDPLNDNRQTNFTVFTAAAF